jgi:hypothetical protein
MGWAFLLATMFAQWPILSKASGLHGHWVAVIVLIGSCIGGIGPIAHQLQHLPTPTPKQAAIVLLAGLINGAAMYFYPVKVADPTIPTAAFITTAIAAMVIMTIVFTALADWQLPEMKTLVGAAIICVGLYVLM